jgi:glycosyltransferase involved in cell wall biosynthesis
MSSMPPIIIIPAYQPDEELEKVLAALSAQTPAHKIILINDGSTGASIETFARIAKAYPQVDILQHAVNRGKGQALKTGFAHFLEHYAGASAGVITADADGQHASADILGLAGELTAHPEDLCLGCRVWSGNVPPQRKLGNLLTVSLFHLLTGVRVSDTQTGLRGIPADFMRELLQSNETGYDFELDMLIRATTRKTRIRELPIQTIYQANNKGSHFHYIRDPLKIYSVLLRFWLRSLFKSHRA